MPRYRRWGLHVAARPPCHISEAHLQRGEEVLGFCVGVGGDDVDYGHGVGFLLSQRGFEGGAVDVEGLQFQHSPRRVAACTAFNIAVMCLICAIVPCGRLR